MVLSVSLLVLVDTGLLSCALRMVLSMSLLVLVGTGLLSCALRMVLSVSLLVLAGTGLRSCARVCAYLLGFNRPACGFNMQALFKTLASLPLQASIESCSRMYDVYVWYVVCVVCFCCV